MIQLCVKDTGEHHAAGRTGTPRGSKIDLRIVLKTCIHFVRRGEKRFINTCGVVRASAWGVRSERTPFSSVVSVLILRSAVRNDLALRNGRVSRDFTETPWRHFLRADKDLPSFLSPAWEKKKKPGGGGGIAEILSFTCVTAHRVETDTSLMPSSHDGV